MALLPKGNPAEDSKEEGVTMYSIVNLNTGALSVINMDMGPIYAERELIIRKTLETEITIETGNLTGTIIIGHLTIGRKETKRPRMNPRNSLNHYLENFMLIHNALLTF